MDKMSSGSMQGLCNVKGAALPQQTLSARYCYVSLMAVSEYVCSGHCIIGPDRNTQQRFVILLVSPKKHATAEIGVQIQKQRRK